MNYKEFFLIDPITLARKIVDVIEAKKGDHILLLDIRPEALLADFIIIANSSSERQLRALKEAVQVEVKTHYHISPFSIDGSHQAGWILFDYGDVIVHLMHETQRAYYNIESLWENRSQVLLSIQ